MLLHSSRCVAVKGEQEMLAATVSRCIPVVQLTVWKGLRMEV